MANQTFRKGLSERGNRGRLPSLLPLSLSDKGPSGDSSSRNLKSIAQTCFIILISINFFIFTVDIVSAADWYRWRGPNRDGISAEKGWLSKWSKAEPKQLWKISVGEGYSAVSVSNGRVYTMGNTKNTDTVYCLDTKTGKVIWKHSYKCRPGSWKGTRIAPTVDGNMVYTLSREGDLFCFNAESGKIIWSKELKEELKAKPPNHGLASHPFILDNMLILEIGCPDGSVVAFNKMDGKVIWKSGGEKVGYSTPMTYKLNGRDYLTVFTGTALLGMNISNGKILWRHEWKTDYECSIATPIVSGDKIFISSGYGMGCALIQISEDKKPRVLWKNQNMANHMNSSVLWKGYIYGFHGAPKNDDKNPVLKCLDFKTGNVVWSQGGLGKGSLMLADGKLIIMGEKGDLVIAEASPGGYKEISRSKVLDGTCWTMPVLSGGKIYCRSHEGDLVCLDVRKN
jgi:outer membrane protein assembly factor BamB